MSANINYPWKRYWTKQGENPSMEGGLFIEPTQTAHWFGTNSNGVSLLDLNYVPCLVLLGAVGMGKSTTIKNHAEELKSKLAGAKHAVVYQDLKRLSETQIERNIFHDPDVEAWLRGEHALTLLLDSLDECWRRIDALELFLVDELKRKIGKETPPLFLRLTCRSAEWRGGAGKTLERLFPPRSEAKSVQIFDLAPLSANNVREAAESNNLNGNHLLERIAEKEAQALASHPITFRMLLQIYQHSGDFPASRVELYKDGCLRLCEDDNVVFGSSQQKRKTTPQERLAIAGRLAALSVFTNRFLINGDLENPASRPDVLEGADVTGYFEEQVGGNRVVVNRDTLTETLQTALFAERSEGAQSWRHQSYAEFLAAHYLTQRGLTAAQISSALTDTTDNTQRIIPQLEETACWIAEMIPNDISLLTRRNADVFLRCDSTYWNDRYRTLLVQSYLELVRGHEATELDWQLKHKFSRLAHADLATQLRPIIINSSENPLVRETALDIAGYCKLGSIAPELLSVILNANEVFRVRKHAAIALKQAASDETRLLLRQWNLTSWDGDVDDDLKGYYLQTMWPSHMSFDELLPLLRAPKRKNYTGAYKMFLEYELPTTLSDTDLPQMLDWIREKNVSFDILGNFGYLPSKLLIRALNQMHVDHIRDAVLRLLSFDDHRLHHMFRGKLEPEVFSPEIRLRFWAAVAQSDLDIQKLIIYGDMHSVGMLSREDSIAFIKEYRKCSDHRIRDRWRMLVFSVISIEDLDVLDQLSEIARTDIAIENELAAHTSCPLVPDEKNWIKDSFERQQKRNLTENKPKPSLTDYVLNALDAFESGKLHAFWHIGELLDLDPEKLEGGFSFLAIQLSDGKAWKSLSADVQRRILRGIPVYISAQSVDEGQVWEADKRYRPYDVFHPFLVLLFDENPQALNDISSEDWKKWISVFFAYHGRRNGTHDEAYKRIFSLAHSKASLAFLPALKRYLEAEINNDSYRGIIWSLPAVWSAEIKDLLLSLLRDRPLRGSAARDILQLLVSQDRPLTERLLISYIAEMDQGAVCSIYVPIAIATLLTNFPDTWAAQLLERIKADPTIGRAVVPLLVRGDRQPSNWLSEIPPLQLGEFWEWLNQNYPGDPYEKDDGFGSVTVLHDIYHFRNGVFETLRRSGTPEACAAMVQLMRRWPKHFWLGDILAEMRKTGHRKGWKRPSPSALMQLFAERNKRLVRTAGELHSLVLESLQRFESELHGAPPSMELWNETKIGKEKFWQPKDESNLSNCLQRFLERDLKERGIVANREVQIRQRLGNDPAQLVDLFVIAIPFGEDGKPASPVSIVVEVKCAWNDGVSFDMERQLFDRYLKNTEIHFGIYAVAYFTCDAWNWNNDARKTGGESRTAIGDLKKSLSTQANSLTNAEKLVNSCVIDARLNL